MSCPNSEFSAEFVDGMKNRMAVSYAKYGPLSQAYPHKVSALQSLNRRLDKYYETGNTEWLIDVANFAMIEFMRPGHPKAHFRSTDTDESPGRTAHDESAHPAADNASLSDDAWNEMQQLHKQMENE